MKFHADPTLLRRHIRSREISALFQNVPPRAFSNAVELGAGDGYQSLQLARYSVRLLSTDLNMTRLTRRSCPHIQYGICDVEDLPYTEGSFDLVYSSNLQGEHPTPLLHLQEDRPPVDLREGQLVDLLPLDFPAQDLHPVAGSDSSIST